MNEDDLKFVKENYTCDVFIVDRKNIKLVKSENDAYTIFEEKFIAISPNKNGTFNVGPLRANSEKYIYAVVKPKTFDNGLLRFSFFQVKISNGPLKDALVTIKPFDFIPGSINDTVTIRSMTDPVQSFYPLPESANSLKSQKLSVEIVSVTSK
ncbi:hypothetical protein P0Y35_10140 [Kiritimatiellaeota bacterium B1221]|nr:hypothetical protein [Kiritimatiellaeota bacterium B1221]